MTVALKPSCFSRRGLLAGFAAAPALTALAPPGAAQMTTAGTAAVPTAIPMAPGCQLDSQYTVVPQFVQNCMQPAATENLVRASGG